MCLHLKEMTFEGHYKEDNFRGKKGEEYHVKCLTKCGNCIQCVAEKANNWVIRNYYESKAHDKICFITLTYKDNPYLLYKKDFQLFMKRLRITLKRRYNYNEKIRFFLCGEYGERTKRPHGHLIIYNWNDPKAKELGRNKKGNIIKWSKIIDECWGLGITTYQEFEKHEIPYITLYETAKEREKHEYIEDKKGFKKLKELNNAKIQDPILRRARNNLIDDYIKRLKKSKNNYITIKEFNTWSKALGWQEFYKEFKKDPERYTFTEYIDDKEFVTPTPWVKKLANMGYKSAIAEMLRRAEEISNLAQAQAQANEKYQRKLIKEYTAEQKESEL